MNNSWTAGQYRVFRVIFGLYLVQHFLSLLPWGSELFSSSGQLPDASMSPLTRLFPNVFLLWGGPHFVDFVLITAAVLSVLFTLGKRPRLTAALVWYLWACFYGRNPLIGNPSLPFIGWLLLAFALVPSPSDLHFTGKPDSSREWRLPADIFLAAWILMSAAYLYSGSTKLVSPSWIDGSALRRVLENPLARDTALRTFLLGLPAWVLTIGTWAALALELSFAPIALSRRLRPLLWTAMVSLHLGLLCMLNFTDLTAGMLVLHCFTFDPGWIRAPRPAGEMIFFDGRCGLCHGLVRFVLQEDQSERPFLFAPLQGHSIRRLLPNRIRLELPGSVAVLDPHGWVRTRSEAVIYIAKHLGGLWFLIGTGFQLVPRALRDGLYDRIATLRKSSSMSFCPLGPPMLQARMRD